MRRQIRGAEPAVLADNKKEWTDSWVRRSAEGGAWSWPRRDKTRVNQVLVPLLSAQTAEHCSFCDNFPVPVNSLETIEHFRPKERNGFPHLAFEWDNLFYCCTRCQKKRHDFSELLLKPDEADYEFSRYFMCDFASGMIEPNPGAAPEDQERARETLRLYRLNDDKLPEARRRVLEDWLNPNKNRGLEEFSFRDFLEAGL